MRTYSKPLAAALAAGALTTPVAAAIADPPQPTPAPSRHLLPPLAGHRTVAGALHDAAQQTLLREHARLAARAGRRLSRADRRRLRSWSLPRLRRANRTLRRGLAQRVPAKLAGKLSAIAACESHGNPRAIGGGGAFRGKYQFDYGTWAAVGGSGDPAAAPEREQDHRAALLLQRAGSSPWPVCG